MKYRKKPVVIEAIKYDGLSNIYQINEWTNGLCSMDIDKKLIIQTLEGDMTADVGDWIIKGIKGEFYPCKPDIFEMTYEKVE